MNNKIEPSNLLVSSSGMSLCSKQTSLHEKITQQDQPLPHLPFHICRDGTWLYRGSPIKRKALICLFASLLRRDSMGRYWLKSTTESGLIHVEDVPFMAIELDFRGKCNRHQTLCFRTNVDELICLGEDHPLICDWDRPLEDSTVPYIHVRDGEGDKPILARVSRALLFELAALATIGHVNGKACLGVWSRNCFFPLSRLADKE
ncbi:DUF1285 domain-containing protein [Aristophania vespae]|uniref:DUF1285 domain-containing protein n=1 Tax=Aristophania vespae TaxID=2697033 RepID=UPI002351A644|nr:DUF1285 domain-containing protein [Aristophania vespae]UMM63596.1 hypothetical protein DM15PD_05700 [Aristophania vespae]